MIRAGPGDVAAGGSVGKQSGQDLGELVIELLLVQVDELHLVLPEISTFSNCLTVADRKSVV